MNFDARRKIRDELDCLVVRAMQQEQCELLLRQMAEAIIDVLAEAGPKAQEHLRRLTNGCLHSERQAGRA